MDGVDRQRPGPSLAHQGSPKLDSPITGREKMAAFLETLAAAELLIPLGVILVTTVGFAFGSQMTPTTSFIGVGVGLVALRLFARSLKLCVWAALVGGLVHAGAYMGLGLFLDNSYDGLAYQQEAVLRLADGWDPLVESSARYGKENHLWIDHYPKAPWITGAAVLLGFGRIEPAKLINLTFMLAAFAQAGAVLLRVTPFRAVPVMALAALAALCPVAVYQMTSFYVDGLVASLLTVLIAALFQSVVLANGRTAVMAGLAATLLINIKFTGLLYVVLLFGAFLLAVAWRSGVRRAIRLAMVLGCTGLVATLALGYAPYTRNWREQGHIFYPIKGGGKLVEMSHMRAVNIADRDRFTRFLISNFSRSESIRPPGAAQLKIPFRVYPEEKAAMAAADLEIGGFGPFYGALLMLGALGWLVLAAARGSRPIAGGVAFTSLVLLATIFSHSEGWWARYAPQSWLLPLLVAAGCLLAQRRITTWLGWLIIGVAAANVAWTAYFSLRYEWMYTQQTRQNLAELSRTGEPVSAYFGRFHALRRRLEENQVKATIVNEPPASAANLTPTQRLAPPIENAYWFR